MMSTSRGSATTAGGPSRAAGASTATTRTRVLSARCCRSRSSLDRQTTRVALRGMHPVQRRRAGVEPIQMPRLRQMVPKTKSRRVPVYECRVQPLHECGGAATRSAARRESAFATSASKHVRREVGGEGAPGRDFAAIVVASSLRTWASSRTTTAQSTMRAFGILIPSARAAWLGRARASSAVPSSAITRVHCSCDRVVRHTCSARRSAWSVMTHADRSPSRGRMIAVALSSEQLCETPRQHSAQAACVGLPRDWGIGVRQELRGRRVTGARVPSGGC